MISSLYLLTAPLSVATQLPTGVLSYVKKLDPQVKVRADGLIMFGNGDIYLPILPQDPTSNFEPKFIIRAVPEHKHKLPDLVQFDNNLCLLKLSKGSHGKWQAAKLTYPIEAKEGLLPQDLVLPPGTVIPAELKVILGAIKYNRLSTITPTDVPAFLPITTDSSGKALPRVYSGKLPNSLYVAEFQGQQLQHLDLTTGKTLGKMDLGCIPSSLHPSLDGHLLLATCLNANQLTVVDPISQQIRAQLPTGKRPASQLYLPTFQTLLVANRYDSHLTVFPLATLMQDETTNDDAPITPEGDTFDLPSPIGLLLPGLNNNTFLAADAQGDQIYLIDWTTRRVHQTYTGLPAMTGMAITTTGTPDSATLWVISRTQNSLNGLLMKSGTVSHRIATGKKPVSLAYSEGRLYVLSAEDHRVDVIDPVQGVIQTSVTLPVDSFPSHMVLEPNTQVLFVSAANQAKIYQIGLTSLRIEKTWNSKANLIAFNQPVSLPNLLPASTPISALAVDQEQTPKVTEPKPLPKKHAWWQRFSR